SAALLLFAALAIAGRAAAQAPPPGATAPPRGTELSDAQKRAIDAILTDAKAKAGPLTAELGKGVREVRDNLLPRKPDQPGRQRLITRMPDLAAQLVALRINATARILGVLTAEQKDLLESEETKVDWNLDVYEILVKVYGLPRM